jgi:hypothetical protein
MFLDKISLDEALDKTNGTGVRQSKNPAELVDRHARRMTDNDQRGSGFPTKRHCFGNG